MFEFGIGFSWILFVIFLYFFFFLSFLCVCSWTNCGFCCGIFLGIFYFCILFVVVKNSPLFLYWQRYHVHSTYSEQYHRNQHSKMLSLSATLHLKDSHALHHEICSITHIYIGICILIYIYIYKGYILVLYICRFHIVGSSQDIYVYIF